MKNFFKKVADHFLRGCLLYYFLGIMLVLIILACVRTKQTWEEHYAECGTCRECQLIKELEGDDEN